MAVISLFANGEAIALDVTTSVEYTKSATISTTTIFNGANISDNYRPDKASITFNGVVSATKTRSNEAGVRTPKEFREMVDNWIDNKYLIRMYGTYDGAIPTLSNLGIQNYNVTRDGTRSDGLAVSFSLKQLDISNSVQKSSVTIPKTSTQGLTSEPSDIISQGKTSENTKQIQTTFSGQLKYGKDSFGVDEDLPE